MTCCGWVIRTRYCPYCGKGIDEETRLKIALGYPVDGLCLWKRPRERLANLGIETAGQLSGLTAKEIISPGVKESALENIRDELAELGLHLADDRPESWRPDAGWSQDRRDRYECALVGRSGHFYEIFRPSMTFHPC